MQPCETYHLQLVVADASDRLFDSGVFIAKMKSNPITMQLITDNGASALVEGCNNGSVRFSRPSASPWPLRSTGRARRSRPSIWSRQTLVAIRNSQDFSAAGSAR